MQSTETVQKELVGLERKYWQAMVDHDLQAGISLTDFPCIVAGPQGVRSVDQSTYEKMFSSHDEKILRFDFHSAPEVRLLSDDTAIVAYEINATVVAGGKEAPMRGADTSTWVKRNGAWKCAQHSEAILRR